MYHQRCQDYYGLAPEEAEVAITTQLRNENPELTKAEAEAHSASFVRESRNLSITVEENNRKAVYQGPDIYARFRCSWG